MTSEAFAYWLKGFFEISDAKEISEKQVQIIKDHLDLVFHKVTPNRNEEVLKEEPGFRKLLFDEYKPLDIPSETKTNIYCSNNSGYNSLDNTGKQLLC